MLTYPHQLVTPAMHFCKMLKGDCFCATLAMFRLNETALSLQCYAADTACTLPPPPFISGRFLKGLIFLKQKRDAAKNNTLFLYIRTAP
jgi:hypothetical protein